MVRYWGRSELFGSLPLLHIKQPARGVIGALKDLNTKVVVDRTGPVSVDPSPVKFVCVDQVVTDAGRVVEEKIRLFAALAVADADDPMSLG